MDAVLEDGKETVLEKEMATLSSVLVWRIPWTEEPGGLQSMGSQREGHNWMIFSFLGLEKCLTWSGSNPKLTQEYLNEGFFTPHQDTDGYYGWLLPNFSKGQLTVWSICSFEACRGALPQVNVLKSLSTLLFQKCQKGLGLLKRLSENTFWGSIKCKAIYMREKERPDSMRSKCQWK